MDSRAFCITEGFQAFCNVAKETLHELGTLAALTYDGSSLRLIGGSLILLDADTEFWDPRGLLGAAATGMVPDDTTNIKALGETIEAYIKTLYSGGRQGEGIHGEGLFASAFRRLYYDHDFLSRLVGFGPGSTPAGDDYLAGFLAGRDLLEGGPGRAQTVLRAGLRTSLERTTPAGRALLIGALEGVPPAYLVELTLAAASWLVEQQEYTENRLYEAVKNALGHGATSGEDALCGFMYALGRR